ncbi:hypothetical protein JCM11641_005677 [Rhodosporidiobolus odoratus]
MPKPELAEGFEWQTTFDELLEQTASSNVVDADWPILKDMIKHKLAEAISSFLAMGPPWPLAPEEAFHARTRAYDTLDSFGGPPFTIQRLCELALYPRSPYTSLPKYLRAVSRVLSVTSERSAFTEDDSSDLLASTSAAMHDTSLGVVSQGVVMSPAHHTHRRGSIATSRPPPSPSPSPSPRSSPAVVPLLSPIPWLRKDDSHTSTSTDDVEPLSLSSPPPGPQPLNPLPAGPSPGSATDPTFSSPVPLPQTSTPTGGLVDEVDPGSGTGETADPVALSSATTLSPQKGVTPGDLLDVGGLRERFVRASSPRAEVPEVGAVEGQENGREKEEEREGEKMDQDT